MTRLLEILIAFAIVAALFLLVAMFLPSSRHLVEKVETNRKQTIVFDTLNGVRRFAAWNPVTAYDPSAKLTVSGPASGVGARVDWVGSKDDSPVGKGYWEIVESVPKEKVVYKIEDSGRGHNKRSTFTLKPTGRNNRNVEISQSYDVDYGFDPLARYAGLYAKRNIGDGMKLGLQRLIAALTQVPNVDYAVAGSKMEAPKVIDRPAEDVLFVNAGDVERKDVSILGSMNANSEWIKRVMAANDLEPAGPMRIITTELGRETYTFDVAQPVRKKGTTAPSAEPLKVTLQGPVQYVRNPPTKVAVAGFTGYLAELEQIRNGLRAWALTNGYEVVDRPYENYKTGPASAFTENGQYDVHWMLK